MKVNYGIVAYTIDKKKELPNMTILHFCGYDAPPTKADIKSLAEELNTDESFGLVGRVGKDVFLTEATDNMVKVIADSIKYANKV